MKNFLISYIFLITLVTAQVIESVSNNSFILKMNFESSSYIDSTAENVNYRNYFEYADPDNQTNYQLPKKSIIIAIPPNSTIYAELKSKNEIIHSNTIPINNPIVKMSDEGINYFYENVHLPNLSSTQNIIDEIKYFWLRDFYCAEIPINTHRFNPTNLSIQEIDQIEIAVKLNKQLILQDNSPLQIKSIFDENLKDLFANWQIAEQFRSKPNKVISDSNQDWINFNNPYYKLSIIEDGIYRLDYDYLSEIDLNFNGIDPQKIKLYESGIEIPIYVSGQEDNVFNEGDYIEFYGQKNYSKENYRIVNQSNQEYNEYMNRYSDTSYYFLTFDNMNGNRIRKDSSFSTISNIIDYFIKKDHYETNTMYQNLNNDEVSNQLSDWNKNKTFYWNWLFTSPVNYNFTISERYNNKPVKVLAKFVSAGSNIVNNAHQLSLLFLNDTLDFRNVNRFDQVILEGSFNSDLLINGNNKFVVSNKNNGTVPNFLGLDWYEIEYPRILSISDGKLNFNVDSLLTNEVYKFTVNGANPNLEYIIYRNGDYPKLISRYTFTENKLIFSDTLDADKNYSIFETSQLLKPSNARKVDFQNLRNENSQSDYIALTSQQFQNEVNEYLEYLSGYNAFTTKIFFVEDIYNEFGYGYPTPESIKQFLEIHFNNAEGDKPTYLTLFGDASYDYKDYLANHNNVKLSQNIVPSFGNPLSDYWYVQWNNSIYPQMIVGRIPFLDKEQFSHYFEKIKNNNQAEFNEWNKKFLFFSSGNGSNPSELAILKSANDKVVNDLVAPKPIAGNYHHFYKTSSPQTDFGPFSEDVISKAINDGSVIISYLGHSGTATWDNSINNVEQLKNSVNRNPLITDFGCSTNKFGEYDIICFGERFLLDNDGQAIGYVGNSSLGFLSTATTVPYLFYKNILSDSASTVGEAHLSVKYELLTNYGSSSVNKVFVNSNVLLGDPSVKLKVPQKPNLSINGNEITLLNSEITDQLDSAEVRVIVKNLGLSFNKSFKLTVNHLYQDNFLDSLALFMQLPDNSDTLIIKVNIKNLAGQHKLVIQLDTENEIEEIYENDNNVEFNINVYSNSVKDFVRFNYENPRLETISFLNPVLGSEITPNLSIQLSKDEDFTSFEEYNLELDTVISKFNFTNNDLSRYWYKFKDNNSNQTGIVRSFSNIPGNKFFISDSVSIENQSKSNIAFSNQLIELGKDSTEISVLSAGWNAGSTCVITKNGINLLSNSYFAGMGIVVFDPNTLEVESSNWYQLFGNTENANALASQIESIEQGKLVVMGVADDGQNRLIARLRTAIKTLGSTKIDSLVFRGSWAIIGYKGGTPEQAIEQVKGVYDGSIFLSKKYEIPVFNGSITTTKIGPTTKWDRLVVSDSTFSNSSINYIPIALTETDSADTLSSLTLNNGVADLSFINAEQYPYLKIKAELNAADDGTSPELYSLGVDYTDVSELAINYQVVSIEHDSITQGENNRLNFMVYNVGESSAQNFKVKVELQKADNSKRILFDQKIALIDSMDRKQFSVDYIPKIEDGTGELAFNISIDPENNVREFFEDNNFYRIPFKVVKDTSVSVNAAKVIVKFDGNQIFDGDYVSPTPEIDIELDYNLGYNYSDTSEVNLFLNNIRIHNGEMSLKEFDTINRKIIYSYKPVLESGNYNLAVRGRNLIGNLEETDGYTANFIVSDEFRLMDVYTYPNPTNNDTYFTFMLTKVPDELEIKVYTIAGRLIKKLNLTAADLKLNFNKIYWDCKDEDGDPVANGTYLYKVTLKDSEETISETQKMAIVR